jgi:hypothetical protein
VHPRAGTDWSEWERIDAGGQAVPRITVLSFAERTNGRWGDEVVVGTGSIVVRDEPEGECEETRFVVVRDDEPEGEETRYEFREVEADLSPPAPRL